MAVNHFDCVGHIVLFDSVYMIIHSDTFDKKYVLVVMAKLFTLGP